MSTEDQTVENQRADVVQLAAQRGYEPVVLCETVSGTSKKRAVLDEMMRDVRRGKYAAVCVWALDRLTRRGAYETLGLVLELDRLNVRFLSVQQPYLDTASPFHDSTIAILADVAKLESDIRSERTIAGLKRARAAGKRLGRPPANSIYVGAAADRIENASIPGTERWSVREAARFYKIPREAILRELRRRRSREKQQGRG